MNNTKLLVAFCFLIITSGLGFLFSNTKESTSITAISSPISIANGEKALVTNVVDGDTIKVEINNKEYTVRFVGMDTPETKDPRRPVGCFGKEASNETSKLLSGKLVYLQKDITNTDKYDRILRYVYLPLEGGEILFVNDYLVREGFAHVYTYPPDVKYDSQFKEAERVAREGNKGLWSRC